MTYLEILEKRFKILNAEKEQLRKEIEALRKENEELKKELNRPERMTDDENRAFWGIYG